MNPRVSVVIVSYRSRDSLGPCLASLRVCAEAVPLEVVVVDNASDDGTPDWLADRHPWVLNVVNADNRGFGAGVNQGVARTRAGLVLVLNPDCEVAPEALACLVETLERSPGCAVVAPALMDEAGREARSCGRFPTLWSLACDHLGLAAAFPRTRLCGGYKYGGIPMTALDRVDWASGAALLVRREAFAAVGGFDENLFLYMEEVDWCRRAARSGWSVRYQPAARVMHAGGRSSRTVPGPAYLHNLRSRVYYVRKHLGRPAALAARLILTLSLALKWAVTVSRGPARARVYADGLGAVWAD